MAEETTIKSMVVDTDAYMMEYSYLNDTNDTFMYSSTCNIDIYVLFYIKIILSSIALIGNVSFVFVVFRVKSMRTIPNLNFINLAAADTLLIITEFVHEILVKLSLDNYLPYDENMWLFHDVFPKLWIFVTITFLTTALLTISLISIERYIAVCHPFKANILKLQSKKRVLSLMVVTWLVGMSLGAFAMYVFHLQSDELVLMAFFILFTVFTVLPLCVTVVCYTLVVVSVLRMKRPTHTRRKRMKNNRKRSGSTSNDKHVLLLCVMITLLFLLCFAPVAVTQLINTYSSFSDGASVDSVTMKCLQTTQTMTLLIHLALSPILYNGGSYIRRRAFRQAFDCIFVLCETNEHSGKYEGSLYELRYLNGRQSSGRGSTRLSEV